MQEKKLLPPEIDMHLTSLENKLGLDARNDIEAVIRSLMVELTATAAANPASSSALFLSRPTGYVT